MDSNDDVVGPINLGNPDEFTMRELADLVKELTGSRSKIVHRPLPQDDPRQRRPDISEAERLLGWRPDRPAQRGPHEDHSLFRGASVAARTSRRQSAYDRVTRPDSLVTGGAGYVGSHACKALARAGYRPVTYDNLSTGHESFVRWGPLIKATSAITPRCATPLLRHEMTAVLHFAACAYVGESVINPQKYYDNNVTGTLSLLAAMLDTDTLAIVFSSSCAIYGEPEQIPITESCAKQPVNPYGASKLMIERVLTGLRARLRSSVRGPEIL